MCNFLCIFANIFCTFLYSYQASDWTYHFFKTKIRRKRDQSPLCHFFRHNSHRYEMSNPHSGLNSVLLLEYKIEGLFSLTCAFQKAIKVAYSKQCATFNDSPARWTLQPNSLCSKILTMHGLLFCFSNRALYTCNFLYWIWLNMCIFYVFSNILIYLYLSSDWTYHIY